jgi:hypothetical protein
VIDRRKAWAAVRMAGLVTMWLGTLALMVADHVNDPFNPLLEGTRRYGHNDASALERGVIMTAVELAVLVGILRPWSYWHAWLRALIALIVLVPWTFFALLLTMHAGGIMAIHAVWCMALCVVLLIGTVWSGVARAREIPGTRA